MKIIEKSRKIVWETGSSSVWILETWFFWGKSRDLATLVLLLWGRDRGSRPSRSLGGAVSSVSMVVELKAIWLLESYEF